jgi:hypothetical protein
MANFISTWCEKAVRPFKTKHYVYNCNASASDARQQVEAILSSKYYRGSPNITGSIKENSFYAYHKWTMIRVKGGGKPVWINGLVDPINLNTSIIHITVECHPTLWAMPVVSVLLAIFLLLLLGVQKRFVISGEEWAGAVAISFALVVMFLLPRYAASSLTQGLRQTFEEAMDIQPIDTHSM